MTCFNYTAVLDAHRKPLMPCSARRAHNLVKAGRAKIVRHTPRVIQLLDRTVETSVITPMVLKIDPGSKTTGFCVALETRPGVFSIVLLMELTHRSQEIRAELLRRTGHRRHRRSKLRYREPRHDNRKRKDDWLPPSQRSRLDATMAWIKRFLSWYPIARIVIEDVRFDMQKMRDPGIEGIDYQRGDLCGYELKEAMLAKHGHQCVYCDAKNVPLEKDHVRPRSRDGSNALSNLVPACRPCNQRKGNQPIEAFLSHDLPRLTRILRQTTAPLKDAAAVNTTRKAIVREAQALGLPIETGSGGLTKWNRTRLHLPKTHGLDAACAGATREVLNWHKPTLCIKQHGRGKYARTLLDKYGFPRLHLARKKKAFGFQTGDLVKAVQPSKGVSVVGRVTVRQNGGFIVSAGTVRFSVTHRHCTLIQHADGYSYHSHWLSEILYAPVATLT